MCGYAVATSLATASQRSSARLPEYVQSGGTSFHVDIIDDNVGTQLLTRVLLASPDARRGPGWTPPGLADFPHSGEAYASPALLTLARKEPALRRRLGLDLANTRTVTPSGLTGPDDLILYRGVAWSELSSGQRAVGWGSGTAGNGAAVSASAALIELALLVGLPALLVLMVCARLSSATRLKRMRSLRVLGLSSRQLGYLAALEGRVSGLAGAAVALGSFRLASRWLASGAAGYTWFPADTALRLWSIVAVLVLAPFVVGRVCRLGALRVTDAPSQRSRQPRANPLRLIPVWLGILSVATFIVLRRQRIVSGSGGGAALLFLGGSTLLVFGFVLALRPTAERAAAALATRTGRSSLRLAARRVEDDAPSTARLLAALVVLVITAGIGTAVLRDVALAAGSTASNVQLVTTTDGLPSQRQRAAVLHVPAQAAAVMLTTPSTIAAGQALSGDPATAALQLGVPILFARCTELVRLAPSLSSPCRDGAAYRVADTNPGQFVNPLPKGHPLALTGAHDSPMLRIPAVKLRFSDLGSDLVSPGGLVITQEPPLIPDGATITALVTSSDAAITAYQNALARISPLAHADVGGRDLTTLRSYRTNSGIIHFGVSVGFGLALCAFGVALIDRQRERRRALALLMSVGAPRRFVLAAQAFELIGPAAVALSLASIAGFLVGTGYLTLGGLQSGIYWPTLAWGLTLSTLAAVALGGLSAVLPQRGNGADIRRD